MYYYYTTSTSHSSSSQSHSSNVYQGTFPSFSVLPKIRSNLDLAPVPSFVPVKTMKVIISLFIMEYGIYVLIYDVLYDMYGMI